MHILWLIRPLVWALALCGVFVLAIVAMLAVPLAHPPALASVHAGARAIDMTGLPELSRFQARDGTSLGYRLYSAGNGATDRLAILVHGSSGNSADMNVVARLLAENGIASAAIDMRGHGTSGTRGDIGYLGQLDDDLTDLIAELRPRYPSARLTLVGHSAGGGFALRIAGGPVGKAFDRFVLTAPYLGYTAPTNHPAEGSGRWADADIPRILAQFILLRLGIDWAQAMPVIAFAVSPGAAMFVTPVYSFRLLANFGPPRDWQGAFAAAAAPIDVIVGANDELMAADRYPAALQPFADKVHVTVLPGLDHMAMLHEPAALARILASVRQ